MPPDREALSDLAYYAKGAWLMGPDSEGEPSYLRLYRCPDDAQRAARDIQRRGIAWSPAHYMRLRRMGR